ncbi:hypothetical protein E1B28_002690 [Marasmius oreades]|uniref:Uncharacterized protein n=1 Tax=Marasmius oreades TaxID=181124 RepID=A0A9P7RPN0_9AGAR|nr:uncharacterized protein E1B28_002690 [Marasmius oreades]KAG7086758.1 hypothetical protein E1B28_002690 [Marasmius oreades]
MSLLTWISLSSDRNRLLVMLVVTTPEQASILGDRAVVIDDPGAQDTIEEETDATDICHTKLEKLVYLLYIYVWTGTPKGSLLKHRGLYWAIEAMSVFPAKATNADTDE